MLRNNFCLVNENVPRKHSPSNSQFLRQIMHEEQKSREIRDQEILMTSEVPLKKEQQQEEEICKELQSIEREKFLEAKRKALLHQNEDEIRQLVTQIKRANVQKQLIEQKASKENKLKEDFKARLDENRRYAEELECNKKVSLKEEIENAKRKDAFRQELLKQMQERDKQRAVEREMINKEREGRQKLLENIRKDIESEKQHVLRAKEMLRKDRDEYLKQLELHKTQQKLDAEEDHRKYLEWLRQRDEKQSLRKEKRKQAMKMKEALSENIGKQVFNIQEKKQKRENLLSELLIGERLAKDEKRHQLSIEKQIHRAKNLRDDFLRFFEKKQQEALLNREREKLAFQEELGASGDFRRAEIGNKSYKIPSKKQYCQDLLNIIEHKKYQREFAAQQNKTAYEQELLRKQKYQQEVAAEKLRLLKAQPKEILKFLPLKTIAEHRSKLGLTCKDTKEKTN